MIKTKRILSFDGNLCMGCHACEVACKAEHQLPPGVSRARILTEGPVLINGKLELKYQRKSCLRCPNPPCIDACPNNALQRRSDGIVFIQESLCSGCRSCAAVCPENAIDFHPDSSVAQICDMCADRLDQGLLPFCLKHCMSSALFFGTEEEYEQMKKESAKIRGEQND
jgi:Fe-S-cluster-containing dehydrogenase component